MLTQQQADDLNLQLHAQEAAELWLNNVNKQLENLTSTIKRMAEVMKTATPEQQARLKALAPQLLERYNNAKLQKQTYEDQYWWATSKINEYNALWQQQPATQPQTKRRTITPNAIPTTDPNKYMTPVTEWIGWISTPNWPRYWWWIQPMVDTRPQQYMTPVSEATLPWWISTANWPRYVWRY